MDVVLLTLADAGSGHGERVPVLRCRDALRDGGADVETRTATSDREIDEVLQRQAEGARLIVAAESDGQVRAVMRRMMRRYADPPSRRSPTLPDDRTLPDLPTIGILPLDPTGPCGASSPEGVTDLADRLGLPRSPEEVAAAVLSGRERRVDLLRNDGGSLTLHGALVGGTDEAGRMVTWRARIEVDDAVLSDGREPLLACAVANADGYADLDELPLVTTADPADGVLNVGVAVPVYNVGRFGFGLLQRRRFRIEVRRAKGRAVAITPREHVPCLDDGVATTLTRKRTWWMERAAWAVYTS